MKTIKNKFNQSLFFLAIALGCTFFIACKDEKDNCQKCAEERAEAEALANDADTSATTLENNTDSNVNLERTSSGTGNSTVKAGNTAKSNTVGKTNTGKEEPADNVSIINPNDKSNSDSKRTYGSSGTGGGSGTSGSGGDGNGSSGWNADVKKDK